MRGEGRRLETGASCGSAVTGRDGTGRDAVGPGSGPGPGPSAGPAGGLPAAAAGLRFM